MDLVSQKCVPCEGGDPPLTQKESEELLSELNKSLHDDKLWEIQVKKGEVDVLRLRKSFKLDSYMEGIEFVNNVAKVAENEGHHPNLEVGYAKVTAVLWTHVIGGLSKNDFIMAAKIENLQ